MTQVTHKPQLMRIRHWNESLEETLIRFREFRHELISKATGDPKNIGKGIEYPIYRTVHPSLSKSVIKEIELLPPQKPVKLPAGSKLVLKDVDTTFKEPIVSPKMQKNLRLLELRLDTKGKLYSPKAFDPEWNWQTQALWFRLIGMGNIEISKRLKKSLNTIKGMFKRLQSISKFYPKVSKYSYPTIGKLSGKYPSGRKDIKFGGVVRDDSVIESELVHIDERSGQIMSLYKPNFTMGNYFMSTGQPETGEFKLKEHKKAVKAREVEARKTKIERIREQKEIERMGREYMEIEKV